MILSIPYSYLAKLSFQFQLVEIDLIHIGKTRLSVFLMLYNTAPSNKNL